MCDRGWSYEELSYSYAQSDGPKPVCYVGCLMIANISSYTSLITWNTTILECKKLVCIFLHQIVNTGDLHLVKCALLTHCSYRCH